MKKEALRVTSTIPVAPTTLYFAWLDSDQHGAMTEGAAKLSSEVGQKYSALNGYVTGKLIILDLGRRLVFSWRTTDFPRDAVDSRVEMHLEALGASTRITVLHTDIPEGQSETYRALWNDKYFGPMRAYFSKYLPDPRIPPPPRKPIPPPDEDEEEEDDEAPVAKKGAKPAKVAAKAAPPARGPSVAKVEAKSGKKLAPAPAAKKAAAAPPPAAKKAAAAPPPAPAKKKAAPPPPPAKKAAAKAAKPAPKPAAKKPAPKPAAKKPAPKPAKKTGKKK